MRCSNVTMIAPCPVSCTSRTSGDTLNRYIGAASRRCARAASIGVSDDAERFVGSAQNTVGTPSRGSVAVTIPRAGFATSRRSDDDRNASRANATDDAHTNPSTTFRSIESPP